MTIADPQSALLGILCLPDSFLKNADTMTLVPSMFKADEGPLDVEDIVSDHIGFTVFHQKLKTIHHLMDLLFMQHVTNQAQVHILCEEKKHSALARVIKTAP